MQGASFMVDALEHVVDVVVHYSHCVVAFFCSGRGELVVVIEVYGAWIKAIETSPSRECVGSGGCGLRQILHEIAMLGGGFAYRGSRYISTALVSELHVH